MQKHRPTWDELCMNLAFEVRTKSTCLRRQVGAVLVTRGKRTIIALGWNGAPQDHPHCEDIGGCLRDKLNVPSGQRAEICRAVHAEQNVIITCAKFGGSTENTILYVTNFPCIICAKLLVQSGIKEIVYSDIYGDAESYPEALSFLSQEKITIRRMNNATM